MVRFGTAGVRGPVTEVTPEAVLELARAATILGSEFVVAEDGRETSPGLGQAAVVGLVSGGASVEHLGRLPTPALAYGSRGRNGLMITASHNPPSDNGVKLFTDGREIDANQERRIESRLHEGVPPCEWSRWGTIGREEVLPAYRRAVEEYLEPIGPPPTDLSIAVDCGNGTASLVVPSVLRDLGVTVRTLNGTIDGTFPARPSKPTAETVGDLSTFVASGPLDLGLAFDGDADRIVVVADDGEVVHEDTVTAILAEAFVRRSPSTEPVVMTTPNASERIDDCVAAAGGRTERTPLGGLASGIERVERAGSPVVFAAEPWKHLYPDFGSWIDAIVTAGVLAKLCADSPLQQRRESIHELPYVKGSVECPDARKAAVLETVEAELPLVFPDGTVSTEYGLRVSLPDEGWFLVRPSGTEPKIRIYVESPRADHLLGIVTERVREFVEGAARSE